MREFAEVATQKSYTSLKVFAVLVTVCVLMMAHDRSMIALQRTHVAQVKQLVKDMKAKPTTSVCLPDGTCFKKPRV